MSKLIKCPTYSYSESREWVLLEENKDYFDGEGRGDEPTIRLNDWKVGRGDERVKLWIWDKLTIFWTMLKIIS